LGAAWLLLPAFWAALYTVALPYTGYYAQLYRDRIGSTFRRTRTFFHFLRRPAEQAELAREGREIIARIRDLWKFVRGETDSLSEVWDPSAGAGSTAPTKESSYVKATLS